MTSRSQAACPGAATHFGMRLLLPEASTTQPHGRCRAHRRNTNSTALQHTLTPNASIVSVLSQVKSGFSVPSEDFVSPLLWAVPVSACTPAVACAEPRGCPGGPGMSRCVEIDHYVVLSTMWWTPSTYHPSWERELQEPKGTLGGRLYDEDEKQRNRSILCPQRPYATLSGFERDKGHYHYHFNTYHIVTFSHRQLPVASLSTVLSTD